MKDIIEKPPTQGVGVSGFNAFKTPADEPHHPVFNWYKLFKLPPFEMYGYEISGLQGEELIHWASLQAQTQGEKFYQDYANWHKQKGYWVNETPMGEVIESGETYAT